MHDGMSLARGCRGGANRNLLFPLAGSQRVISPRDAQVRESVTNSPAGGRSRRRSKSVGERRCIGRRRRTSKARHGLPRSSPWRG